MLTYNQRNQKIKLEYNVDFGGVTLRQWVNNNFPHIDYERLQQSIRKGDIRVNNEKHSPQKILNIGDVVKIWDKLCIDDSENSCVRVDPKYWKNIPLIEENENFWVFDKPYGLPSQRGHNIKVSVVEIMNSWMGTKPYIVHRLDRNTTGLMVVAKNSYAAWELSLSLQNRLWTKVYHAILEEPPTQTHGVIDDKIDGQSAKTNFRVIDGALVEFRPITGRKHQIRKHAAKFLSPVLGDEQYGNVRAKKMFLRCVSLSFPFRGKKYKFNV